MGRLRYIANIYGTFTLYSHHVQDVYVVYTPCTGRLRYIDTLYGTFTLYSHPIRDVYVN